MILLRQLHGSTGFIDQTRFEGSDSFAQVDVTGELWPSSSVLGHRSELATTVAALEVSRRPFTQRTRDVSKARIWHAYVVLLKTSRPTIS